MRNATTHRLSYLRALDTVNFQLAQAKSLRNELVRAAVASVATSRVSVEFSESEEEWFARPLSTEGK